MPPDERLAQLEDALAAARAGAAGVLTGDGSNEAVSDEAGVSDTAPRGAGTDADSAAPREAPAAADGGAAAAESPAAPDTATTAHLQAQIETLQALRVIVQRRATLAERLAEATREAEEARASLEAIDQDGLAGDPPYAVSMLDQAQAELASKQAIENVAETRLRTARRRKDDVEKALSMAVRERRAARELLRTAEADGAPESQRMELAQRLAELNEREAALRQQMQELATAGDRAEAALYGARRRLARAGDDADRAALEAWVEAWEIQLRVARVGVDALAGAIDRLAQMRSLWKERYRLMNEPESVDIARLLRRVIAEASTARSVKTEVEGRLSGLRSMQLAQTRRLRDPDLSNGVRRAPGARGEAPEQSASASGSP